MRSTVAGKPRTEITHGRGPPRGGAGLSRLFAQGPNSVGRRQTERLAKMDDGAMPEVLKAQQYFIRCFANLADSHQSRGSQNILNACRKSNAFDRRIVRQFRRRIDKIAVTHFVFTFSRPARSNRLPSLKATQRALSLLPRKQEWQGAEEYRGVSFLRLRPALDQGDH
jgi:hypothetical protein